jgi:hypothetical protein
MRRSGMTQVQARSASECIRPFGVYSLRIHSLALRACIAVLLISAGMLCQRSVAQDAIPGWHTNLEDARRLSESTGKPLFITFRCVR